MIDLDNSTSYDIDLASLEAIKESLTQKDIELLVVHNDEIQQLNKDHRKIDKATDVLSFPMDELRAGTPDRVSEEGVLGDVVLCPAVAARQGEQAGHSMEVELRLLLTHGILHLLGHDHAEPDEHKVMFGLQAQLLAQWEGERNARGLA